MEATRSTTGGTLSSKNEPLVEIRNLRATYPSRRGFLQPRAPDIRILDRFNLEIYQGETLGIVGESGCGKTTLANAILRLIPGLFGTVLYQGQDLVSTDNSTLRSLRSNLQIIFQNPFSSLNPRMAVHKLVAEPLVTHTNLRGMKLRESVLSLLEQVGLNEEHINLFAHQLSGGQAQRVAIARALALKPSFLILDEPTSALDVSIQAQIINLLVTLQRKYQLTYLFISHDLGVMQHISDRIAVMHLGEIVEVGNSQNIFQSPRHPYTQALISATPRPVPNSSRQRIVLDGSVPSPASPPSGCKFHTRCRNVLARCSKDSPNFTVIDQNHKAACHLIPRESDIGSASV